MMRRVLREVSIRFAIGILVVFDTSSTFTARASPPLESNQPAGDALQSKLNALEVYARPGILGAVVLDTSSGKTWSVNAERALPMMSVFKVPVGAYVLSQVDASKLSLDQEVRITHADLRYFSAIRDNFHGSQMTYTIRQLLSYALSKSDNTAADALLRLVGGPHNVTEFLHEHGVYGMRVDRDERTIARDVEGLDDFDRAPSNETEVARNDRLRHGQLAYLRDPRDRSSANAAVDFLRKLLQNQLLSKQSSRYLLELMATQVEPRRLRSGLPANVRFADKCGTSISFNGVTAAYNDIGIITWPNGHSVIVAIFLAGSRLSERDRLALFTGLAHKVSTVTGP